MIHPPVDVWYRQMMTRNLSRSNEDFLKAVYSLQQAMPDMAERVSTNALRDALDISAPSVTDMAQRLMEAGYIDYLKYQGVRLTETGEEIALMIVRRHRLIELYLVQELGYELHEVHNEAEALEHAVSDRFIEAIAHKLDHPEFDPHGDPIPAADGSVTERRLLPLIELPTGIEGRVSRFTTADNDMLQHTLDRGFRLDASITVIARDPFDGPLTIQLDDSQQVIGHNLAQTILVEVIDA